MFQPWSYNAHRSLNYLAHTIYVPGWCPKIKKIKKKEIILWLKIPKPKIPSHKLCSFFLTPIIAFKRITKNIEFQIWELQEYHFMATFFWEHSMWWPFVYEVFSKCAGCNLNQRSLYLFSPLTSHFCVHVYIASKKLDRKPRATKKKKKSKKHKKQK